jgi:hypothetical protein
MGLPENEGAGHDLAKRPSDPNRINDNREAVPPIYDGRAWGRGRCLLRFTYSGN